MEKNPKLTTVFPLTDTSSAMPMELLERLQRIEVALELLVQQKVVKQWYSIAEFAKRADRAEWTVREWARTGRIHAEKRRCGRSKASEWMVSHEEWQRYNNEGLLPTTGYHHFR